MAQRLVNARYEYNWNPLVGSLVGALRAINRPAQAAAVSMLIGHASAAPPVPTAAADGLWFAPAPDLLQLPSSLTGGLRALGVDARIMRRGGWLLERRLRRDLAAACPFAVAGAGVDPFGPAFGLVVGFDDQRRAWRRDGPMTDQVGPWLPYDELRRATPLVIIRLRPVARGDRDAQRRAASSSTSASAADTAAAMQRWIAILAGEGEIDPQGHARAVQAFAAARGEAADFWLGFAPRSAEAETAQSLALILSRFATLFPYPMGGAPNARGAREAGAAILLSALSHFRR